jgi:ribosomal protein S18 acetylase RimI-like enzyme
MNSEIIVRSAEEKDHEKLENFLRYEYYVHQHLDWRPTLDWLGFHPFLIALDNEEIIACLAVPREIIGVAWIRLFACSSLYSMDEIWDILFKSILSYYDKTIDMFAVLGIHHWFVSLLLRKSFSLFQNIIVFEWQQKTIPMIHSNHEIIIQRAEFKHIPEIAKIDSICFAPLWQLPADSMYRAYQQSGYPTIALYQGRIIGYQMCTESYSNAHLARLAVDPAHQGKKIGKMLLQDVLKHYVSHGIHTITVNTQDDNYSSQALYTKMGFILSEEKYPVLAFSS